MPVTVLQQQLWDFLYDPTLWLKSQSLLSTLVLSVIIMACLLYQLKKSKSNLPPGPTGLPVVGFMPFLKKNAYMQFLKLAKKYGDVFR